MALLEPRRQASCWGSRARAQHVAIRQIAWNQRANLLQQSNDCGLELEPHTCMHVHICITYMLENIYIHAHISIHTHTHIHTRLSKNFLIRFCTLPPPFDPSYFAALSSSPHSSHPGFKILSYSFILLLSLLKPPLPPPHTPASSHFATLSSLAFIVRHA